MPREKQYICYYCGRMMDDVKAARVIRDLPYEQRIHACVVCDALTKHVLRAKTLWGRQDAIRKILGPDLMGGPEIDEHGRILGYRFVNRDGFQEIKPDIRDR